MTFYACRIALTGLRVGTDTETAGYTALNGF